jgi:FGGY family of carbohydrate kinases, N-terminal domain
MIAENMIDCFSCCIYTYVRGSYTIAEWSQAHAQSNTKLSLFGDDHLGERQAKPAVMYVLGVDGGTESLRVGIYDTTDGCEVATASCAYVTAYPKPGHAEQNPEDWWSALRIAVKDVLSKSQIPAADIKGMVRTNSLPTYSLAVCLNKSYRSGAFVSRLPFLNCATAHFDTALLPASD